MDPSSPQPGLSSADGEPPARKGFRPLELAVGIVSLLLVCAVVAGNLGLRFFERDMAPLSETVLEVRTIIQQHKGDASVVLAESGYPVEMKPQWFDGGDFPLHVDTGFPLVIEIVDDGPEAIYPVSKVFDPRDWEAPSAWYNAANGAFCVRVMAGSTPERTLAMFNEWNLAHAEELHSATGHRGVAGVTK